MTNLAVTQVFRTVVHILFVTIFSYLSRVKRPRVIQDGFEDACTMLCILALALESSEVYKMTNMTRHVDLFFARQDFFHDPISAQKGIRDENYDVRGGFDLFAFGRSGAKRDRIIAALSNASWNDFFFVP